MSEASKIDSLAGVLYTQYCEAVGGKSWDGKDLPTWADFVLDPKKQVQVEAWRVVAETARKSLGRS